MVRCRMVSIEAFAIWLDPSEMVAINVRHDGVVELTNGDSEWILDCKTSDDGCALADEIMIDVNEARAAGGSA